MFKKFIITFTFSFLLIFLSCNNSVSPFNPLQQDDNAANQTGLSALRTNGGDGLVWIDATGSFSLDSDFAEQIPAVSNNVTAPSIASRAAFPETVSSMTGITYTVTATAGTLTSTGTVDTSNNTYAISLAAGYTWQITIEIKNADNKIIMSGGTEGTTENPHITVSTSDPYVGISNPIVLKPLMGTDNGFIELYVDCTGITENREDWNLMVKLTKEGSDPVVTYTNGFGASGNNSVIYFEDIPAGIYTAELKLINTSFYPVYMDTQTINVYSNLTTRRWGASGGAIVYDSVSSSYKYKITDAHLQEFALTTIWVGTTKVGTTEFTASAPNADGTGGNGTFVRPFATLQQALTELPSFSSPKAVTINVTGEITGTTKLSDSEDNISSKASSITITGSTGSGTDSLKGVDSNKEVLTIETSTKLIIKKLKITGGTYSGIRCSVGSNLTLSTDAVVSGNSCNGYAGGIYLQGESDNKAVLVMESSAKISGNHGGNAGGLYISNAILYMSGSSLIGDKVYNGSPVTSHATATEHSNYCASDYGSGGAIYLDTGGEIWMGYKEPATGTDGVADDSFTGGMFYNYSPSNGGAIYQNYGTIHIHKGDISFNATADNSYGGAIYCNSSGLEIHMEGGTLKGNYSKFGGAIYNRGTLYMTGGTIGDATYQNTVASNGNGGAIYQNGTFEIGSGAKIWPGSLRTNDVFLHNASTSIKLTGNIANTSDDKVTVSYDTYQRRNTILEGASFIDDNIEKFEMSDPFWTIAPDGDATDRAGYLTTPVIYVASSAQTDEGRHADIGKGNSSGPGTKTTPFDSITQAAYCCNYPSVDYTIYLSGTLQGSAQSILNQPTINGKSITIAGYPGSGACVIDRGLLNQSQLSNGYALKISKALPITLKDITIQGANTSGDGGGLFIAVSGAIVNLTSGVRIQGNKANSNGAGVYVIEGAYLGISNGVIIGNESATLGNVNTELFPTALQSMPGMQGNYAGAAGGGIFNSGTLVIGGFISPGSPNPVISEVSTDTGSPQISFCAAASGGAGIYNDGTMYFYSGEVSENYTLLNGAGILNFSENCVIGGTQYATDRVIDGIQYNARSVKISKNRSLDSGGGIYNYNGKKVVINGAVSFIGNQALGDGDCLGGGIYNKGTLEMNGGENGISMGTYDSSFNANANISGMYGGAIYNDEGNFYMSGKIDIPLGYSSNPNNPPVVGIGRNDIYILNSNIKIKDEVTHSTYNMSIAANDYSTTRTILTKDNSCDATKFSLSAGKFKLISDGFYNAIDVIQNGNQWQANIGIDISSSNRAALLSKVSNITGTTYGGQPAPFGAWMRDSIDSTNYSNQANYYILRTVNHSNTHAGQEDIIFIKFVYNFVDGKFKFTADGYYYPMSGDPYSLTTASEQGWPVENEPNLKTMTVGEKSIKWSFVNSSLEMSPTGLCWVAVP